MTRRRNELVRVCGPCGWRAPAGYPPRAHEEAEHDGQQTTELVAVCGRCDGLMRRVRQVGSPPGAVVHVWSCSPCGRLWRVRELAQQQALEEVS